MRNQPDLAMGQPAIGYVSGLKYPVVYQGGFISWWPDDAEPATSAPIEVDLPVWTALGYDNNVATTASNQVLWQPVTECIVIWTRNAFK
jgi:hypothetical protein